MTCFQGKVSFLWEYLCMVQEKHAVFEGIYHRKGN